MTKKYKLSQEKQKKNKSKKRYNPKKYPLAIQPFVEIDYVDKLNPAQREWLAAFNEAEYGANPKVITEITGKKPKKHEKKRMYLQSRAPQRDVMAPRKKIEIEESDSDRIPAFSTQHDSSGETALDDYYLRNVAVESPEDALIEAIDKRTQMKKYT